MYALIVPVLAPFVLLATVMGLSWWEDHVLPPRPRPPSRLQPPSRLRSPQQPLPSSQNSPLSRLR